MKKDIDDDALEMEIEEYIEAAIQKAIEEEIDEEIEELVELIKKHWKKMQWVFDKLFPIWGNIHWDYSGIESFLSQIVYCHQCFKRIKRKKKIECESVRCINIFCSEVCFNNNNKH